MSRSTQSQLCRSYARNSAHKHEKLPHTSFAVSGAHTARQLGLVDGRRKQTLRVARRALCTPKAQPYLHLEQSIYIVSQDNAAVATLVNVRCRRPKPFSCRWLPFCALTGFFGD